MSDASIPRHPELPPALDYAFLRAEGLAHIQRLSGLLWTDHNTHDPGITILETLCYALTDLAYRTRFPTADLLTGANGEITATTLSSLPPAHEVLPTAPRTIADYRRLLLHIEGVRNAWLDPMQDVSDAAGYRQSEVPIHADYLAGTLSFEARNANGAANPEVKLSGLYKVQLELEIDDVLGSMNESALLHRIRRGPLKGVVLAFDCADANFVAGRIDFSPGFAGIDSLALSPKGADFDLTAVLRLDGEGTQTLPACSIRIIDRRPRHDRPEVPVDEPTLHASLLGTASDDLLPRFWKKQQQRARILNAVHCVLHAHRGLCEDFLSVATLRPFHIGICADLEVRPDADLEQVQAQVFHAIENHLSPPLPRRTLEEMLRAGHAPDEIYNGPAVDFGLHCDGEPVFTKAGFVTDADLAASSLRRTVQASDLVARMLAVDGVEAVSELQLRAYRSNGEPDADAVKWMLPVPPDHQPVFHAAGSKLLFRRAGIPWRARFAEFERTLAHLRALDRRLLRLAGDQVLPTPRGRWRNPTAFHSIQNDLPATYKVGAARISPTESPQRIARARQLKAYLAFFDHLLAGYLAQLANLPRLYSLDATLDRSAFTGALRGVPGSLEADFSKEFYLPEATKADFPWGDLSESEESFLERRNRVLDQLIARFAERFSDHALLSFRQSGDRLGTAKKRIADKIDFLADYPRLSRERAQAANLRPQDAAQVWNSSNVSGLERRIARLFGITPPTRHDLHCAAHRSTLIVPIEHGGAWQLRIADAAGEVLFASAETFSSAADAGNAADAVYPLLEEESAFEILPASDGAGFRLGVGAAAARLTHQADFDSAASARQAAHAIVHRHAQLLASAACDGEGMHLIEHILLRPQAPGDRLMQVCLQPDGGSCAEEDPYSFQASVVLPYWPQRFRDADFRALLERSLREEAPAHVRLRICWVGQQQMIRLDDALHAWLDEKARRRPDAAAVRAAAARLIEVLESLSSVFPTAVLHDCEAADASQPVVRLGATALGIF